jgi:methionyl-tRNA synthetase
VDLDNPYITFENNYIETLWWILSTLYKKGYLYQSVSIQPYSPAAGTGLEEDVKQALAEIPAKLEAALANYKFRDALVLAMEIARIGNKYLADAEPWKIIKEDKEKAGTILNYAVQLVAHASVALEPFIPFTAAKLRTALGIQEADWNSIGDFNLIPTGQKLSNPGLLFEKLEDDVIQVQVDKLKQTKVAMELASKQVSPIKETIDFESFSKMDLRVGQITAAEKVEKSKKLLKLSVNDGQKERTILSGIAEHFEPADVIGRQVCFLANLVPRKIMGQESEGMILMAEDADGSLAFMQPSKAVWSGASIS